MYERVCARLDDPDKIHYLGSLKPNEVLSNYWEPYSLELYDEFERLASGKLTFTLGEKVLIFMILALLIGVMLWVINGLNKANDELAEERIDKREAVYAFCESRPDLFRCRQFEHNHDFTLIHEIYEKYNLRAEND